MIYFQIGSMKAKASQSLFERILFGTIALLLILVIWTGLTVYFRLNRVSETQLPMDFLENRRYLTRELNNNILKSDNLSYAYLYQEDGDAPLNFEILESKTERKIGLLKTYKKTDTAYQHQIEKLDKLVRARFANLDTLMDIKNENRVSETMQIVANEVEQAALETNLKIQIDQEAKKINDEAEKKKWFQRKPKTADKQAGINAQDIADQSAKSISSKISRVRRQAVSKEDYQNSYKWTLEQRNIELSKEINQLFQSIDLAEKNELLTKTMQAKRVAGETNQIILYFSAISSVFIVLIVVLIITLFRKSKRTNYQLQLAKEKSDQLTEAKSHFLATMSHEIRTPLNAISGFTEQLFFEKLPQTVSRKVSIIQSSVKHLVQITNEILDLSKLEKKEIQFELIPFNPNTELNAIKDQFEFMLFERNNELFMETEEIPNVLGDPLRFRQIIINLISNANKFTKDGKISVQTHCVSDENKVKLTLSVSDNGIGMEPRQLERIFEPFEQADLTVTRKYGGTGLGLSITKRIVDTLGGQISVASELGQGTTFTVEIEFEKTQEFIQETITPVLTSFEMLRGKTILIADDEPFNRTLLKSLFHPTPLTILEAENGVEALSIISENHIDLALLDVRMPEMNGHELVKQIQERHYDFPIIGLTATLTPEKKERMKGNGWSEVLTKPVVPEQLKHIIEHVMKSKGTSTDQVNLEGLRSLTNNNVDFYNELIDTFLKSTAKGIGEIQAALEDENWKQLGEIAHQYAAPFKHFEALHCYETLKQLERAGKNETDLETIPVLVESFIIQAKHVMNYIENKR